MESLLQTQTWADFKARHGWQIVPFHDQFLLERSFLGQRKILYGPELALPSRPDQRKKMVNELKALGKKHDVFLTRLDLFTIWSDERARELNNLGLKKSFEEIQPEFRQWLDLKPSPDDILAQMKPKGRYNIGLANRHEVTVEPSTDATIFTTLLAETSQRDGFSMREPSYYQDLIETLTKTKTGELLIASYQGQPLAAAIIGYYQAFASYLHGASSANHRDVMAPFLLHWTVINRAKSRGCQIYDLLAVAPSEEFDIQPVSTGSSSRGGNLTYIIHAKYQGISRFKRQFGGQTIRLLGAWDLVSQPITYQLFRMLERLRRH